VPASELLHGVIIERTAEKVVHVAATADEARLLLDRLGDEALNRTDDVVIRLIVGGENIATGQVSTSRPRLANPA
jgi:hypothetical protein